MPSTRRVAYAIAASAILASCTAGHNGTHDSAPTNTSSPPPHRASRDSSGALVTIAELRDVSGLPTDLEAQTIPTSGNIPIPRGTCGANLTQPNLDKGRAIGFSSPTGTEGYELTAALSALQAKTYMNQVIGNLRAGCPGYTIHTTAGYTETLVLKAIVNLHTNVGQAIAYIADTTLLGQTTHTAEVDLLQQNTYAYLVLTSAAPITALTVQSLAITAANQLAKSR